MVLIHMPAGEGKITNIFRFSFAKQPMLLCQNKLHDGIVAHQILSQ